MAGCRHHRDSQVQSQQPPRGSSCQVCSVQAAHNAHGTAQHVLQHNGCLQWAVVSQQRPSCQHLIRHQLGNICNSRLLSLRLICCCCCSPASLGLRVALEALLLLCPLPFCPDLLVSLQHLIIGCVLRCVCVCENSDSSRSVQGETQACAQHAGSTGLGSSHKQQVHLELGV